MRVFRSDVTGCHAGFHLVHASLRWEFAPDLLPPEKPSGATSYLEPNGLAQPQDEPPNLDIRHGPFTASLPEVATPPGARTLVPGGRDEIPHPSAPILLWHRPACQTLAVCILDQAGHSAPQTPTSTFRPPLSS